MISLDPGAPATTLVAEHADELNVSESADVPDVTALKPAPRVSIAQVFMTARASAIGSYSTAKSSLGIGADGGPGTRTGGWSPYPGFAGTSRAA